MEIDHRLESSMLYAKVGLLTSRKESSVSQGKFALHFNFNAYTYKSAVHVNLAE